MAGSLREENPSGCDVKILSPIRLHEKPNLQHQNLQKEESRHETSKFQLTGGEA